MMELCGKCRENRIAPCALSRKDNRTKLCSKCEQQEAFDDYFKRG